MEDATPDQLETEVRDIQILLAAMKKPMVTMVSEQQDAKHWVQQIGIQPLFLSLSRKSR